MNIVIVEDLESDFQTLQSIIDNALCSQKISFHIEHFSNGNDLKDELAKTEYDIFFLDVLLGNGSNGMDIARAIRASGCNSPIVFTTSERDYAVESYEIHAFDYILKPYNRERVKAVISRFISMCNTKRYISLMASDGQHSICTDDIMWAESDRHKTVIHIVDRTDSAKEKTFSITQSMEQLAILLPQQQYFYTCCRGILVNIAYIDNFHDSDVTLTNGQNIPVSRRKRKEMQQLISAYSIMKTREAAGFESITPI